MAIPELLRRLLTAPGPSGYETPPTAVWREAASEFAEVTGDPLGSSVARVPGTGGGPLLALLGHIDEIGVLVTHVDEHGFAYLLPVGGTRADVLLGQRVELLTRNGSVPGVVGRKWSKRPRPHEKPVVVELDDLHVDRLRYVYARPYTQQQYERSAAWMADWGLLDEGARPERLLSVR